MFKQRLITGLIVGPAFLSAIIFLNSNYVAVILGIMVLIGSWEWTKLAGIKNNHAARFSYSLLLVFVLWICWYFVKNSNDVYILYLATAAFWCLALVWIMMYPAGEKDTMTNIYIKCIVGYWVLIPVWFAMYQLHKVGYLWFIYLMVLIWVADSGAYFAGKAWGKHKLAPRVSPGKSWEGVIGALVLSGLYAFSGIYWMNISSDKVTLFIVLSIMIVPVSILGDLFESMIKRHSGYKDSGNILPGHGGILDRIDSLTSAAPLFMLGLLYFQII